MLLVPGLQRSAAKEHRTERMRNQRKRSMCDAIGNHLSEKSSERKSSKTLKGVGGIVSCYHPLSSSIWQDFKGASFWNVRSFHVGKESLEDESKSLGEY